MELSPEDSVPVEEVVVVVCAGEGAYEVREESSPPKPPMHLRCHPAIARRLSSRPDSAPSRKHAPAHPPAGTKPPEKESEWKADDNA